MLKPAGMFLLVDNISPQDKSLADVMNHIEKARDPSHVYAYNIPTWLTWLTTARLELHHVTRFKRSKTFSYWTSYARTPEAVTRELEAYILSLPEEQQRYLEVTTKDRKLETLSHEVMVLMTKMGSQ